jgi:hypothetical protein
MRELFNPLISIYTSVKTQKTLVRQTILAQVILCPRNYEDTLTKIIDAPLFMKLKADFTGIPQQKLNQDVVKYSDGRLYYRLYFQVEMTLRSASLTFALNYKGESYETKQMEFV